MNIYVTGDLHGDIERMRKIKKFCKNNQTDSEDVMIVLGDAGLNFHQDLRDVVRKEVMRSIPIKFLFIHGNHEIRPQNLEAYKEIPLFGNKAYFEKAYPNLFFLKDGEEYLINDKRFLVLGGAYSVDKFYRLANGLTWFEDEQLPVKTQKKILKKVKGREYDVVLSHTCPLSWQPTELFLPGLDQSKIDKRTEEWLEDIKNSITFQKWFFGHFHGNKKVSEEKYEMLFNEIRKID